MNEEAEFPRQKSIGEQAMAWWVRCDAGPLSPEDRTAFDAWIAEDAAHRAAFDDASRLFGEVQAMWAGGAPAAKRRHWRAPALALLAASLAMFFWFDELSLLWRSDFRTGTGETRLVTLEDGSQVELAARSAIAVNYKGAQRRLGLLEGEAWFEVAPDPARPFVVDVAGGTVTALGTAFDIALERNHAEVSVAENRAVVESGGQNVIVEEGRQSAFGAGAPITRPEPADLFKVTSWRRGRLIFEDQPLSEVLETLGRYHHGYFFAAPSVRRQRVTGSFDATNPLGTIRALEASLNLHAAYFTDYLVFLYE